MAPRKTKQQLEEANLKRKWYSPEAVGAFAGVQALKTGTKIKTDGIKEWLKGQEAYTLHKTIKRRFPRRRVIVRGIDDQWQADLLDVSKVESDNDGVHFLLTCIDVFSKFAWIVPLKNKSAEEVVAGMKSILNGTKRRPRKLHTDKGSEFVNKQFKKLLKDEKIHYFHTENDEMKASIAERFNRTIKGRIWKFLTARHTHRYIDLLQKFVISYNKSYHRSIGMSPNKVNKSNASTVRSKLYPTLPLERLDKKNLIEVGSAVRLNKTKRVFDKGYLPNWTKEVFTVVERLKTRPITYRVHDYNGSDIAGSFYREELQVVKRPEFYDIEEILGERTKKGVKEVLIKWKGYDKSFNQWIAKKAVINL